MRGKMLTAITCIYKSYRSDVLLGMEKSVFGVH